MPTRAVAFSIAAAAVLLFAADLPFLEVAGSAVLLPLALLPLAVVGALVAARVPRNPVGWLTASAGLAFELNFTALIYAWNALVVSPGTLPGGAVAALIGDHAFPVAVAFVVLMLLHYPSGHDLGGWWTRAEIALIAMVVTGTAASLVSPGPLWVSAPQIVGDTSFAITNPLALDGLLGKAALLASGLTGRLTFPAVFLAPASLIVRYRRTSPVERAQIRWLAYVGTAAFAVLIGGGFLPGAVGDWAWGVGVTLLGMLPIAIAVAIFRYRLYDIDVLIRRTVIYAVVSAVLLVVYLAVVTGLQVVLAPVTAGSGVAVTVSTLVVVALFQPVRMRIQGAVDRRFYRARYDAERTLDAFAERLSGEVDLSTLARDLVGVVTDTVRPRSVSVWFRRGERRDRS